MAYLLLFSVFVIATCGLVYELIAGTLASYLLGDSVTQFSTIIGVYLFSMGVGSYLSKFVNRNLMDYFIRVEILVGLVGGFSAAVLFLLFEQVESFRVLLYSLVGLTGTLVGLEIPLLMRILEKQFEFKELVSRVFTFDYIGALLASLIFPLVLAPQLGLIRTSFLFGMFNVAVAGAAIYVFRAELKSAASHAVSAGAAFAALVAGFVFADQLTSFAESSSYADTVLYADSSPYQRLVLTRGGSDLRLYLNGNLQFSSADEYRYHEALVHPGLQAIAQPKNVLVLGGGDGLAIREILKHPAVQNITLVDLDPKMTQLFKSHPLLTQLNANAFANPKVKIINGDAFLWLKANQDSFQFVVVDFPDPSNFSIGKLYSQTFYRLLYRALSADGFAVVQSTSPYVARKSFWCVDKTMRSVGFQTCPYHAYVPSFGDWGYVLAGKSAFVPPPQYIDGLRFISTESFAAMLQFPPDIARLETEVNQLNNQALVDYFEHEWAKH